MKTFTYSFPLWNKVDTTELTIVLNEDKGKLFIEAATNGTVILEKMLEEGNDDLKGKIYEMLDLCEEIEREYIEENWEQFKSKSNEFFNKIKLI
jgi:DNA-directed RNA polymerase alpha subunit